MKCFRFIKGYAKIEIPMYMPVLGDNASHKNCAVQGNAECDKAFKEIKRLCTTTTSMAFAHSSQPLELHTYASTIGLGAILYQEQKNVK